MPFYDHVLNEKKNHASLLSHFTFFAGVFVWCDLSLFVYMLLLLSLLHECCLSVLISFFHLHFWFLFLSRHLFVILVSVHVLAWKLKICFPLLSHAWHCLAGPCTNKPTIRRSLAICLISTTRRESFFYVPTLLFFSWFLLWV